MLLYCPNILCQMSFEVLPDVLDRETVSKLNDMNQVIHSIILVSESERAQPFE